MVQELTEQAACGSPDRDDGQGLGQMARAAGASPIEGEVAVLEPELEWEEGRDWNRLLWGG